MTDEEVLDAAKHYLKMEMIKRRNPFIQIKFPDYKIL